MYKKILNILIFTVLFATGVCNAQHKASPTSKDWTADAETIIKGERSKLRQAELLYRWICSNISLDTSGEIGTADECWNLKAGGSLAFCELYYRLAEAIKLDTYIITGVAKNQEGVIHDHVWLMVKIDDGWIFTDPSWGAGSVIDGVFQKNDGDISWFNVDPHIMISSHYPSSKGDQMISPSIEREEFEKLEYIDPVFGSLGLRGRKALNIASVDSLKLPKIYGTVTEDMHLKDIPLEAVVDEASICRFESGGSLKYNYEIRIDDEPIPSSNWIITPSMRKAEFIISGKKTMMIYILDVNAAEGEVAAAFEYEIKEGGPEAYKAIEMHDPYLLDEIREADNANIPFMKQVGIDGHMVLEDLREHGAWAIPILYKGLEKIEIIDVPMHSPLKVGETYTFEFRAKVDEKFVIVNEDVWEKVWDRQAMKEDIHKMSVTVEKPGFLGLGINVGGKEYKLLLEYEVIL